jgi:hypothetical protein
MFVTPFSCNQKTQKTQNDVPQGFHGQINNSRMLKNTLIIGFKNKSSWLPLPAARKLPSLGVCIKAAGCHSLPGTFVVGFAGDRFAAGVP